MSSELDSFKPYSFRDMLAGKSLPSDLPKSVRDELREVSKRKAFNRFLDDKRLIDHKLNNQSATLSKHQHILQAMNQSIIDKGFHVSRYCGPSRPVVRRSPGKLSDGVIESICPCCNLPIIGNSDGYCNRQICLDVRMAQARQKLIDESGQYLVQWETMEAEIKSQRFDDKAKAEDFYVGVYANCVSAFLQYPDGRVLE